MKKIYQKISTFFLAAALLLAGACYSAQASYMGSGVQGTKVLTFDSKAAVYGIKNSPSVRNLQKQLIRKKFATKSLRTVGITGSYFKQTQASVAKLQRFLGYKGADADGILGKTSAIYLGLATVRTYTTLSS